MKKYQLESVASLTAIALLSLSAPAYAQDEAADAAEEFAGFGIGDLHVGASAPALFVVEQGPPRHAPQLVGRGGAHAVAQRNRGKLTRC